MKIFFKKPHKNAFAESRFLASFEVLVPVHVLIYISPGIKCTNRARFGRWFQRSAAIAGDVGVYSVKAGQQFVLFWSGGRSAPRLESERRALRRVGVAGSDKLLSQQYLVCDNRASLFQKNADKLFLSYILNCL